jgi:hypothetical protein
LLKAGAGLAAQLGDQLAGNLLLNGQPDYNIVRVELQHIRVSARQQRRIRAEEI